jgi:ADP-ribose pyrophosphatase
MKKWQRHTSELILDTRFFKVRKDIVELPTKELKEWTYWDSKDSVMVVGMTEQKKLVMIKQYRYLVDNDVIEFPSGGVHDQETIEDGARREFEEESGYRCQSLVLLGSFYETYGQLNRRIHLFFSSDILKSEQDLDTRERGFEDIDVELVDFHEAVRLAKENKIVAMGSSLAILLLKEKALAQEIIL